MYPVTIRCPRCGGKALYDKPFVFQLRQQGMPEAKGCPVHVWRGWYVVEKYPSVFPWQAPAKGSFHTEKGVVRCAACHFVGQHKVEWPQDAYFRWNVRGHILWAWSEEHARVLLAYLGGTERDPAKFPAYTYYLRRMPKAFITAKVRERIVKQIRASLQA